MMILKKNQLRKKKFLKQTIIVNKKNHLELNILKTKFQYFSFIDSFQNSYYRKKALTILN